MRITCPKTMAGCSRIACATRLLLLLLLLALPAVVQAQFTYMTTNGTITITRYTGPGGAVSIPSKINGVPVASIGDDAFLCCYDLTGVTIPNSVTSIGRSAFFQCYSLASVTIPDSVTSIGECAFLACHSLTNFTIGNSVTSIGSYPFADCPSLTAITVDTNNHVYSSVDGVLFNKNQTTLIRYPEGKAGRQYTIPDSVTTIEGSPALVTSGEGAFSYCLSLTGVTIPDSVTNIGMWAFSGCTGLTNVTIGNGVISIGGDAFSGCTGLTNITLPNSVTSIGDQAFIGCYSLASVTIPNSVTSIGSGAFSYCYSLTNVTIGNGVTSIGYGAFYLCTSLSTITVDESNPTYSSVDGVLFNKNHTALISYPEGKAGRQYTIPNSVTGIGDMAFHSCTNLTSITIPDSVTSIGAWAFQDCTSLTSLYFAGNAPSLGGAYVFDGDNNATVYYLPGTTGWTSTFGGLPTALWFLPNPLILNNSFGVKNNRFGFIISWATNRPVVVEACTNIANHTWSPVSTNTLSSGSSYFSDPQWTNYPGRFYRLRSQ